MLSANRKHTRHERKSPRIWGKPSSLGLIKGLSIREFSSIASRRDDKEATLPASPSALIFSEEPNSHAGSTVAIKRWFFSTRKGRAKVEAAVVARVDREAGILLGKLGEEAARLTVARAAYHRELQEAVDEGERLLREVVG